MEKSKLKFSDGEMESYILCDTCGNPMHRRYNDFIQEYHWICSNLECPES